MVGFARLIRPTYAEANVGHPSSSYGVLLGTDSAENPFEDLSHDDSFPQSGLADLRPPRKVPSLGRDFHLLPFFDE